ncbi:MAG: dihydroorotase [Flavobacteriaceae bacterium]|nr:dihydroorotase [Flavobacteriaceae bacterium]
MNILIKSATIIDEDSAYHQQQKDILIENGVITKIANRITNAKNYRELVLEHLHVSCGWFDTSVSFGEPGYEERETLKNGLKTAAKSGFTAVAVNSNTNPVIDTKSAVEFLVGASKSSMVDLLPIASLTKKSEGQDLAEIYDMQQSGAVAFGDYNKAISNANLLKIALLYAQNFGGLVLSFPQNDQITNNGSANEGHNSTRLGLKGNPTLAEELQIARDLSLLEYTGGKLHIPTISTVNSVKLIKEAKRKGLDVSCSVSAHHLTLTDDELNDFDTRFKVTPPLRTEKDIKALIKGIKDGTIDMVTSDHNPIDIENKKLEFENALDGTIGLESLFGVINPILDINDTVNCLSKHPRKRFGLVPLSIKKGEKANLTLFNPHGEYLFTEMHIRSFSKNSAFLNKKLKGKVYGSIAYNKLELN